MIISHAPRARAATLRLRGSAAMAFPESVASAWSNRSASPLEAATASTKAPPRPPPEDATTAAPWSRAMSAVASVEPPSATITSSVAPSHAAKALRTLAMHRSMQPASFLAAMHTERRAKPCGATAWGAIVPSIAASICGAALPLVTVVWQRSHYLTQIGRARSAEDNDVT